MRILFIGDIVGRSGRAILNARLPGLIKDWKLELVVVNGENAAGGFGITEVIYNEFIDAGADAVTLGNHAWDQREALVFIERAPRLIRPVNYPKGTPGRGAALVETKNGKHALVINAMGRIFMDPLDDPFAAVERELAACALMTGADAITLGNHAWDQREALVFIERAPRLIRPVNYPKGTPGRGAALVESKNGKRALVINAMGRVFMDALDDPFAAVERELAACPLKSGADAIIIDMHCEATSEKQSMGYFVDGRASLVVGTHTHVPTADHRIMPGRTAFVSDVGMTGDFDSVIGMTKDEPLNRFLRKVPGGKFEAASGPATLCGLAVETDDATGLASKVGAVRLGGILEEARADFWE